MDPNIYRLNDPSFFALGDPEAVFKSLRREDPVHWTETNLKRGFWSVTTMPDVMAVFRDAHTFPSGAGGFFLPPDPQAEAAQPAVASNPNLVITDPPRHGPLRKAFNRPFLPRAVKQYEDAGRKLVAEIIDGIIPQGKCNFVTDIATKLPMAIICDMMQVPRQDWNSLFKWANMAMGADDPEYQIGTPAETHQHGYGNLFNYTLRLGKERRGGSTEDLMSIISNAVVQDAQLDDGEVGGNGFMFVIGGLETTRNAISGGMLQLIKNPGQMRLLREDRSLLPKAIEEIVRWTSPITHLGRGASRDVELHGKQIKKGDPIVVWLLSANRDEEWFSDPDRFDITRTPNEHIGFGYGEHFCLGSHLARLELRLMLNELLDRMPDMEVCGEVTRLHSTLVAGIKSMPVRWNPPRH
ncbi:MAG: cytochrome P450 [Candidatus Binataceae bacterium]